MSVNFHPDQRVVASTLALLLGLIVAAPAEACGPFFPNQMLIGGDNALLAAPVGDFRLEIARLKPQTPPLFHAMPPGPQQSVLEQSAAADTADLKEALEATGLPAAARERLLAGQQAVRQAFLQYAQALEQWKRNNPWDPQKRGPQPVFQAPAVPEGLPVEFDRYDKGLVAFHAGDMTGAQQQFTALLKLPAEQRRYRSTWAAFMMAKSVVDSDPDKATSWCATVRALVHDGYPDNLGLAAASLGWQARAELNRGHYSRAIELYLDQLNTGDATAVISLQWVVIKVLGDKPEVLTSLAQHRASQAVITAYLVAGGGPHESQGRLPDAPTTHAWLAAVDRAGVVDVAGADRLAWALYQAGDMDLARRWVDKAPKDAPVAQWVLSKLLIREGKLDEAGAVLVRVCRLFPKDETWKDLPDGNVANDLSVIPVEQALGELGVLRLARRQYTDALDCLLRGDYWSDAAYVAERVLTPEELMAYVDRNWPDPGPGIQKEDGQVRDLVEGRVADLRPSYTQGIRNLLARRLTRLGRWKEARPYFAWELRPRLDAYVAALGTGHDTSKPAPERAAALWLAARSARHHGMELLATETGPDNAQIGGLYPDADTAGFQGQRAQGKLTGASADELARIASAAPQPDKRYHYCYVAAEHGWSAAALMPNSSEDTAKVLCTAGSWIKYLEPQAADRFYKALVRRCGNTPLGREADQRRWFPKIEDPPPESPEAPKP